MCGAGRGAAGGGGRVLRPKWKERVSTAAWGRRGWANRLSGSQREVVGGGCPLRGRRAARGVRRAGRAGSEGRAEQGREAAADAEGCAPRLECAGLELRGAGAARDGVWRGETLQAGRPRPRNGLEGARLMARLMADMPREISRGRGGVRACARGGEAARRRVLRRRVCGVWRVAYACVRRLRVACGGE